MELPGGKRTLYAAISLALIAPCFWQPRLYGGDLTRHLYNSWLSQVLESGRADGFQTVRQTTNLLFDLLLGALFSVFGAEWSHRIAVSISVLTFVWGALAFVRAVCGRASWHLLPCIAMLAYGWVFHMGFFNFYLSLGLCFWAMALAWTPSRARIAGAGALLVVAYTAHALPVVWTAGLVAYMALARRLTPLQRAVGTAGLVVILGGIHLLARRLLIVEPPSPQFAGSGVAAQNWVFDAKYYCVLAGMLLVWGLLFAALVRCRGAREVVGGVPFQLCVIAAAVVMVLPESVLLPGLAQSAGYIAERMSLGVAVCVCAMLGSAPPRLAERWALVAVAVVFFGFVYVDEKAVNARDDQMQQLISSTPPAPQSTLAAD
jgi:hypothetical protein